VVPRLTERLRGVLRLDDPPWRIAGVVLAAPEAWRLDA
jgi:hypothetical protein